MRQLITMIIFSLTLISCGKDNKLGTDENPRADDSSISALTEKPGNRFLCHAQEGRDRRKQRALYMIENRGTVKFWIKKEGRYFPFILRGTFEHRGRVQAVKFGALQATQTRRGPDYTAKRSVTLESGQYFGTLGLYMDQGFVRGSITYEYQIQDRFQGMQRYSEDVLFSLNRCRSLNRSL